MTEENDEQEFDKAVGQFRLALGVVMQPLRLYGQGHYVDTASEEVVSLALQLYYKLSGLDIPYTVNTEKLHW